MCVCVCVCVCVRARARARARVHVCVHVTVCYIPICFRTMCVVSEHLCLHNSGHSGRTLLVCPVPSQGSNPHVHQNHGHPTLDHHTSAPVLYHHFSTGVEGGEKHARPKRTLGVAFRALSGKRSAADFYSLLRCL